MATYEITTDQGTYEIETEEQSSKPMFSTEQEGRKALKGVLQQQKNLEFNASPGGFAYNQVVGGINEAINTAGLGLPERTANLFGQSIMPQGVAESVKSMGQGAGMIVPIGAVGNVVSSGIKSVNTEKMASNVVNSLIKPAHRNLLFGKNPGLGIAKEGIVANNFEELAIKVDQKIDTLMDYASTIRSAPENIDKTVNLSKSLNPLREAYSTLQRAPKFHEAETTKIKAAIEDLTAHNLDNISVSDAYKVKDIVSKMQSWKAESEGGKAMNIALKRTYHEVDKAIDRAIPELEEINSRLADMISAKKAISNRVEKLMSQEPLPTAMKLVDLPFAAFKTTKAKTLIGSLLAKKYKLNP